MKFDIPIVFFSSEMGRETLGQVIQVLDAAGNFIYVSSTCQALLGFTPEELLGIFRRSNVCLVCFQCRLKQGGTRTRCCTPMTRSTCVSSCTAPTAANLKRTSFAGTVSVHQS